MPSEDREAEEAGPSAAAPPPTAAVGQPNKILFVQGLPEATTGSMLAMLFQQFPGSVLLARHPRFCAPLLAPRTRR